MGLNKEEEEILKQIEQGLIQEAPDLAKTVEDTTLSKINRPPPKDDMKPMLPIIGSKDLRKLLSLNLSK